MQDLSFANRDRDNRPLVLDSEQPDTMSRSSATFRDSMSYCKQHLPRVIYVENVKGCPLKVVLPYLQQACMCRPAHAIVLGAAVPRHNIIFHTLTKHYGVSGITTFDRLCPNSNGMHTLVTQRTSDLHASADACGALEYWQVVQLARHTIWVTRLPRA